MEDKNAWELIERSFYDGIMFAMTGKHTNGTTGALKEAKEYAESLIVSRKKYVISGTIVCSNCRKSFTTDKYGDHICPHCGYYN